ncbi:MAG: hypothetical protein FWC43_12620 [Planctomycetaceae bacterium]|nr:hypothetical protein [Planctomycetaceae bacterium]
MMMRLSERLDQWADGWNPVLVRELRLLTRRGWLPFAVVLYFVLIPVILLFFVYGLSS